MSCQIAKTEYWKIMIWLSGHKMLKFGNTIWAAQLAARPKSSVLFYEKLSTYVSPMVSDSTKLFLYLENNSYEKKNDTTRLEKKSKGLPAETKKKNVLSTSVINAWYDTLMIHANECQVVVPFLQFGIFWVGWPTVRRRWGGNAEGHIKSISNSGVGLLCGHQSVALILFGSCICAFYTKKVNNHPF